jgi:hypothetical protein
MRRKDNHWIRVKGGPLDQSLIAHFMYSEVWRLEGPRLNYRSCEVSRAKAHRKHVAEPQGGPRNRQADTRHLVEGVNTPLTSHILGIREVRV